MTKKNKFEELEKKMEEMKKEYDAKLEIVKAEAKADAKIEVEKEYIIKSVGEERRKIFTEFLSRKYFAMSELRSLKNFGSGPDREKFVRYCILSGWAKIESRGNFKSYLIDSKKYEHLPMAKAVKLFNGLENAERLKNKIKPFEWQNRTNFVSAMVLHGISAEHAKKIAKEIREMFDKYGGKEKGRLNERYFKMKGGDEKDEQKNP
jgi:hypothetical protein